MKRILLKLSGEALKNEGEPIEKEENAEKKDCKNCEKLRKAANIYDHSFVDEVARSIKKCVNDGYEIALVVGAGNIWRGRQGADMDRVAADRMGMLATVINAIMMKDALVRAGVTASVMSAVPMQPLAEPYSSEEAKARLSRGEVVVFGAGLGIPFLSTDTTAAVRAAEIDADVMLMAKNVDYIYTADPRKEPERAEKLEVVKASRVLAMNLKAIDATATAFCLSTGMPIRVFGLKDPADIVRAIKGETVGTTVTPD